MTYDPDKNSWPLILLIGLVLLALTAVTPTCQPRINQDTGYWSSK